METDLDSLTLDELLDLMAHKLVDVEDATKQLAAAEEAESKARLDFKAVKDAVNRHTQARVHDARDRLRDQAAAAGTSGTVTTRGELHVGTATVAEGPYQEITEAEAHEQGLDRDTVVTSPPDDDGRVRCYHQRTQKFWVVGGPERPQLAEDRAEGSSALDQLERT